MRKLISILLIALAVGASVSLAQAHAIVVRTDPADGAVIRHAPQQIRIWFDEEISAQLSQARVLNAAGEVVVDAESAVNPEDASAMAIAVPDLPDGIYNVVYSTLSADDGHATRGHLVFKVAAAGGEVNGVQQGAADSPVSPGEAILRGVNFATLAGLAGAIGVLLLLLKPVRGGAAGASEVDRHLLRARGRVWVWGIACALAGLGTGVALLGMQAAILALPDGGAQAVAARGEMLRVLIQGPAGALWIVRQVLLIGIVCMLVLGRRNSTRPRGDVALVAATALAGIALLAVQALSGHAAAVAPGTAFAVGVDTLHLIAASLWTGGLLALLVGMLPLALARRGSPAFAALTRAAWRPFGAVAAVSVGVLVATGLYSASREVASVDGLLTTGYGRTLLIKVGLVGLAGLFGLLNSAALHPRVAWPIARLLGRPAGWTPLAPRRLPALIASEAVVGLAVLLVTGALTSAAPATGPQFSASTAAGGPVTLSQTAADLLLVLDVRPNRPGDNVAQIKVINTRRPVPAAVTGVTIRLSYEGQPARALELDAPQIGPDTYQIAGDQLAHAGNWQADVVVRRDGMEDSRAAFHWSVLPEPPLSRPVVFSDQPLGAALTWAAVAATAVVLAGAVGVQFSSRARRSRPVTSGPGRSSISPRRRA